MSDKTVAPSDWITPAFTRNVEQFAKSYPDTFGSTITPIYRGKGKAQVLECLDGKVEFGSFYIVFQYTAHAQMSHNIVETLVRFDKSRELFCYTLYDIFNLLELPDFQCYTLSALYDEVLLDEAFARIFGALANYMPQIRQIAQDESLQQQLEENLREDFWRTFAQPLVQQETNSLRLVNSLNWFYVHRRGLHLYGAYPILCRGQREKAIQKLRRLRSPVRYQERLLAFLEAQPDVSAPLELLPQTFLTPLREAVWVLLDPREGLTLTALCLLLTPPCFFVCEGLFLLLESLIGRNALYLLHASPVFLLLPAVPAAILLARFWYRQALKLVYRKSYQKQRAISTMVNGQKTDRLLKRLGAAAAAATVVFFVYMADYNLIFYEDGLQNNGDALSLRGEYILYSDMQSLVYTEPMLYGEKNSFALPGSYRLILKDGREISLLGFRVSEIEENLLPLLREHSEINLPE